MKTYQSAILIFTAITLLVIWSVNIAYPIS